jgi:2-polyprenyl-3-methyl-5-hydroxy-6-metoxy-1,4-benzoquinol methylase
VKFLIQRILNFSRYQYLIRGTPKNASSVLDFGCGSGDFLKQLFREGYRSKKFGTDLVKPGGIDDTFFEWIDIKNLGVSKETYHWITINHVIEHLHNPHASINLLSKVLGREGGIWLSTPNANSILIETFKSYARDIDFPRHRQIFSKVELSRLFNDAGFEMTFINPPRLNLILNFIACANNLFSSTNINFFSKTLIIFKSFTVVAINLLLPSKHRIKKAPELIALAKIRI